MRKQELEQGWRMRCVSEENWQEAKVPGSVYTDLLRNGNMEDPYWKDNEDAVCSRMEQEYEYECCVSMDADWAREEKIVLHFDGLDTVASVFWNGTLLGNPYNMHRVWEYDVTRLWREGENRLRVLFYSPLAYIADAYQKYGNIGNEDTYEGFMHLRKAHYMFGWDWGAHLPDAGIFRPVSLLGISGGRIDSVYIRQRHTPGQVELEFEVAALELSGKPTWQAEVISPDGQTRGVSLSETGKGTLSICEPELWWPNGLGEQPLYQVRVQLFLEGKQCDLWERKIGLRSMTVKREKMSGEKALHMK